MKRSIVVASAVGVLALGGAVAYAAIPDSGGTIHGCYSQFDGKLKVIDSPSQSCGLFEKPISWPATASGGSEVNLVVEEGTIPVGAGQNGQELHTVSCPAGQEIAGAAGHGTNMLFWTLAPYDPEDRYPDQTVDQRSTLRLFELTETSAVFDWNNGNFAGPLQVPNRPQPYKITLKCIEE